MTAYAIDPAPPASLAIQGSDARFPVRRILCIGRNYAAHAREMGKDPEREPPFFFMKPADALIDDGVALPYPPQTQDLQHEVELVVALAHGGRDIDASRALELLFGAAVGLDMTRRDLQGEAKRLGRPWEIGKSFDASAPVGALRPIAAVPSVERGAIWLDVDGERRQSGDLAEQIWSVPQLIAILSRTLQLAPGDVIMTGTPAGVAAVSPGQTMSGGIDGIGTISTPVGMSLDGSDGGTIGAR